ncbi:hypothetical protein RCL1_005005 [Eukaryota sp. TZLM3-RCL]
MSDVKELTLLYNNRAFATSKDLLKTKCAFFRSFLEVKHGEESEDVFNITSFADVSTTCFEEFLSYLRTSTVRLTAENAYPLYHLGWHFGTPSLCIEAKSEIEINIFKPNWFKVVTKQVALNNDVSFMENISEWLSPLLEELQESSSFGALVSSSVLSYRRDQEFIENMFSNIKLLASLQELGPEVIISTTNSLFFEHKKITMLISVGMPFKRFAIFAIIQNWPQSVLLMSLNRWSFGHTIKTMTCEARSPTSTSHEFVSVLDPLVPFVISRKKDHVNNTYMINFQTLRAIGKEESSLSTLFTYDVGRTAGFLYVPLEVISLEVFSFTLLTDRPLL